MILPRSRSSTEARGRAINLLLVIVIQASFYALLGMGYVLIYRATRVLNLAHGDLMVFGAFLFFQGLVVSNGNLPLSVVVGLAGAAVLGALTYLGIMRPLAGYPVAVGVLATIAVGILLRSVTTSIWSGQTRYPAEYLGQLGRPIEIIPGLSISGIDIAIIAAALVAMAGFLCCCSGPRSAWRCGAWPRTRCWRRSAASIFTASTRCHGRPPP